MVKNSECDSIIKAILYVQRDFHSLWWHGYIFWKLIAVIVFRLAT